MQKLHNHNKTSSSNFNFNKIIEVDDPQVQQNVKNRIKQKLLQQAQYLLEKKKRQEQKKQRIRRLEENLQIKREERIKTITEKKNKCENVLEKNKQTQQKKIKQQQHYFKQVIDNYQKKSKQRIQNAIHKQKQLQIQKYKKSDILHRNQTDAKIQKTLNSSRYLDNSRFFKLSQQLQIKTKKAQQNHEQYNQSIKQRLRQKSECISNTQQKALERSIINQNESLNKWGQKVKDIENVHEIKKTQRQKKLTQRKQSFRYKFNKCNQNIKNLQYKEQQKSEKLQSKLFDRKYQPKQWRDLKLQKYWSLWAQNSKIIEQKLNEQANKILQKHQTISQQNRVYKEKKQKLLQLIKHI